MHTSALIFTLGLLPLSLDLTLTLNLDFSGLLTSKRLEPHPLQSEPAGLPGTTQAHAPLLPSSLLQPSCSQYIMSQSCSY